ncbi:MAG: response regulator [Chloroflexia bacterium]|nr:response regulator [Chloroflexia bacterium]
MARILLVEDNELNRDMLSRRLARRGYKVLLAVNGIEGVESTRSEQPDLILLDMRLPVLDGWQVAQQLKQDPGTRHIPIIALTAHAIAGDREKALQAGCDEYEAKPVDFPRLLSKMQALLDRGQQE